MRIQSVVGIFRLARMRSEPPTRWFGWSKRSESAEKAEPPVVAASVRIQARVKAESSPVRALGGIRTPNLLIRSQML